MVGNYEILQVWRVNNEEKILLEGVEQSKFYSGDCYILQYSYPGDDREEYLVGTWLGKQSVEVNFITDKHIFIYIYSFFLSIYMLLTDDDDDIYRKTEHLLFPWQARWLNP